MSNKQITAWRRPESMVYVTNEEYGDLDHKWRRLASIIRLGLEIDDWVDFEDTCQGAFMALLRPEGRDVYRRQDPRVVAARKSIGRGRFVVVASENSVFLAGVGGVQIEIWAQGRERRTKMCCRLTFLQDAIDEDEIFADRNEGKRVMDAIDEVLDADHSMDRVGYRARAMTVYHPELFLRASDRKHFVFGRESQPRLGERIENVGVQCPFKGHPVWRITPLEDEEMVFFSNSASAPELGLDLPFSREAPQHRDEMVFAKVGPCYLKLRVGDRGHRFPRDRILVFGRT